MKIHHNKRFSPSAYDANDPQARRIFLQSPVLQKLAEERAGGKPLVENPDPYGIDFISEDGTCGVEVARKGSENADWCRLWSQGDFRFPFLHIEQRKAEYADQFEHCLYVLFDHAWDWALVVTHKVVSRFRSSVVDKWCQNSGRYEPFLQVPAELVTYVKVNNALEGPVLREGQPFLGGPPAVSAWGLDAAGVPCLAVDEEQISLEALL